MIGKITVAKIKQDFLNKITLLKEVEEREKVNYQKAQKELTRSENEIKEASLFRNSLQTLVNPKK